MTALSIHDRRPHLRTVTWNDGADTAADMGASWNSDSIEVGVHSEWSIDSDWEGGDSPIGTFQLQGRNSSDYSWKDITDSDVSVNGASGALWNLAYQNYRFVRIVYTRTSGGSGDDFTASVFIKR